MTEKGKRTDTSERPESEFVKGKERMREERKDTRITFNYYYY